jgi:uncharacterized protein (TIGR03000 family)
MPRTASALILVAALAAPAGAQPGNLPLSPGVHQGSSIGPGTQFLPQPTPSFVAGVRAGALRPLAPAGPFLPGYSPYPAYGFGIGYGGFGGPFLGYGPGFNLVPTVVVEAAPRAAPAAPPARTVVLENEFPATLTVQFPAPAEVWLNGAAVKGEAAEERVLTSPVLRPGDRFAFDLKARWSIGGKTYEAVRAVTLGPGDRSRLLVVSGTEVK